MNFVRLRMVDVGSIAVGMHVLPMEFYVGLHNLCE